MSRRAIFENIPWDQGWTCCEKARNVLMNLGLGVAKGTLCECGKEVPPPMMCRSGRGAIFTRCPCDKCKEDRRANRQPRDEEYRSPPRERDLWDEGYQYGRRETLQCAAEDAAGDLRERALRFPRYRFPNETESFIRLSDLESLFRIR